ncbi:MAG: DUF4405 domain-containing protein [Ancalomicrobiaceae bacterium]|nr:DUF4405 domain-containing protein [Ancalomicrobiaceae bacterium]
MLALRTFLLRYGTPLTAGLFLVSAGSGVALFFHIGTSIFREMHEIMSLSLLVPVGVHLWRNWNSFCNYFNRAAMPIALALSLAVAGAFAYQSGGGSGRGNPAIAFLILAQSASISDLAPVLQLDEAAALARLQSFGVAEPKASETVAAIAARSGRSGLDVMATLTARQR